MIIKNNFLVIKVELVKLKTMLSTMEVFIQSPLICVILFIWNPFTANIIHDCC